MKSRNGVVVVVMAADAVVPADGGLLDVVVVLLGGVTAALVFDMSLSPQKGMKKEEVRALDGDAR